MRRTCPRIVTALSLALTACVALSACAPAAGRGPASTPVLAGPGSPVALTSLAPGSSTTQHPAASGSPDPSPDVSATPPPMPSPPTSASPATVSPPPPRATPAPLTASRRVAARLTSLLDEYRATESAPGISATVLYPDGTAWTGVSGMADIDAGLPVAPDTAFPVASISKTFLAALVLELSAEGAFTLEDRVAAHVPELGLDPAITVRMLLDHTSGLRDYFEHRLIDRALQDEPSVWWSPTRALGYLDVPYFAPGTGWQYSNTNYLVLGVLVERVTGQKLAAELRRRFLDPLGLRSMWYQDAEPPRRPLAHGYRLVPAEGDRYRAQDLDDGSGVAPFRSVVTAAAGAGSLAGDSRDVARWARALYGGDAIDRESLSLMLSGVDRVAGLRPRIPYGLGVQGVTLDGRRTYGHSGRFLGFRAVMRWLPEEEVAIAILTNQSRGDLGPLTARMIDVVVPDPGPCACPVAR